MVNTFPIQCPHCAEILDVAADVDVAAPYSCPLCSDDIVIAEAEDFDLPCPAKVVIEEQTPERLRFQMPRCLPGADGLIFRLLVFCGFPIYVLFLGSCVLWVRSGGPPPDFDLFLLATLSLLIPFVVASFYRFRSTCIDFSNEHLTIESRLGFLTIGRRRQIEVVNNVVLRRERSDLWPLRDYVYYTIVRGKPRNGCCANSSNRDTARYVTHLIRRQLITRGHTLQDG